MDIKDLNITDILERASIKEHIDNLLTGTSRERESAVSTLSAMVSEAGRKDALYVVIGYYAAKVKGMEAIEEFFQQASRTYSIELYTVILKDMAREKNLSRRRLFTDHFISSLATAIYKSVDVDYTELCAIIENSCWGEKLKIKFLYPISRCKHESQL